MGQGIIAPNGEFIAALTKRGCVNSPHLYSLLAFAITQLQQREVPIKTLFAMTLALGLATGVAGAQAAPAFGGMSTGTSPIVKVEGGCGPYGHRDRFGYCRPNRPPPPPGYYGCPPYTHPTPYGCRRNY